VSRDPRRVALDALARIDDGAYANLLVPSMLENSAMRERDRAVVTELVYGTTRLRRACDVLVDRVRVRELDRETRDALRLGAYQLHFLQTPPHAAVSATVDVAPKRSRGLVNAVLRKVAGAPVEWPDDATRLSCPDWIVDRLVADLGRDDALAALAQMNEAPMMTVRDDGYVQDRASQAVVAALDITPGMRAADTCAGPGGKATGMAAAGAHVAAADVQPRRAELVRANARRLGADVVVATGDGRRPPLRDGVFDRVLVDAPCSGLGVLRRRPDARWRIRPDDVGRLAALQCELLDAATSLVAPGGQLASSVCTLTSAETVAVDEWHAHRHPELRPLDPPGGVWRNRGRGAILLPQAEGTDGMYLLRVARGERT
jgi:16S rRNA (cytosine967-C5)-methyltransferase